MMSTKRAGSPAPKLPSLDDPRPIPPEMAALLASLPWETVGIGLQAAPVGDDYLFRLKDVPTRFDNASPPKDGRKLFLMATTGGFKPLLTRLGQVFKVSINIGR